MSNSWNKFVFNAGSRVYDFLTYQDVWREQIADVLSHVPDQSRIRRVLDLGCGPGVSAFVLAERLPQAKIEGVDLAEKMIERAQRHHGRAFSHLENVEFHVGDATQLPWDDGSFDLAVGHSFLYLVPDRAAVLRETRRLLAPGGTMVLLEPNRTGQFRSAAGRNFGRQLDGHRFLDASRFRMSMVAWRIVSGNVGRLDPQTVRGWMLDAGFDEADVSRTLGGLGMHCIGKVD
jgi:ubiquinone/menaquinone biosynthesis C-methylase UbiE